MRVPRSASGYLANETSTTPNGCERRASSSRLRLDGSAGIGIIGPGVLVANVVMHTGEAEIAGRRTRSHSVHAPNDEEMYIGGDMLAWLARSQ